LLSSALSPPMRSSWAGPRQVDVPAAVP
jgi:hypothetical protein